jgi:anti-sigma-K factor RskA
VQPTTQVPHAAEALLGAYALGALTEAEALQVEAHLAACEQCTARAAEFQQIAKGLLHLAPEVDPPAALRARLMAALDEDAQPARRSNPAGRRLGWAGALAAVALLALNLAQWVRNASLQAQLESLAAQERAGQTAQALRSYPSSQVVELEAEGIRGTLVYDPGFPLAVLYIWGLEDPGPQQAYQAWLISADGTRTSGGLLELPEEQGFAWLVVRANRPLQDYSGFGLTLEPADGSPLPTGPRILGSDL